MAALATTLNSRTAERVMGAYFRLDVAEGTFLEETERRFADDTVALCRLFGMKPVQLRYDGVDRRLQFEAFVINDPADRRVFLTNHARSPERALIGHELVHRMRRERRDLYDELVEALADAGVDHERWAAFYRGLREQTQRKEGRALSDEEIREEGVADLVGDLILDPAVWRALRRPTLLQRVHDWIRGVWRSLRGSQTPVDPLGGASLVRDRGHALAAVSRVLGTWAASLDLPSPAEPAGVPALASAAALRRDENVPEGAFRSALLDALVAARGAPVRASWEQWLGWLDGAQRRGEFRQAERAWLSLDDFLKAHGTVARHELIEFVRAQQVRVQDVVLDSDKEAIRDHLAEAFEKRGYTLTIDRDPEAAAPLIYFDPEGDEISFADLPADLQSLVDAAEKNERLAPKYEKYQLPGGANYRELLLTLPAEDNDAPRPVIHPTLPGRFALQFPNGEYVVSRDGGARTERTRDAARASDWRDRELAEYGAAHHDRRASVFRSGHFAQQNIVAHVRFNERTAADGKRVLFLEEIQSDWAQTGRRKGFGAQGAWQVLDENDQLLAQQSTQDQADTIARQYRAGETPLQQEQGQPGAAATVRFVPDALEGVPDMPFKATGEWAMLAFKRMVVWAAEHGFDRVAWTTGAHQAERYDLSKQVREISWARQKDGGYHIDVYPMQGEHISRRGLDIKGVADFVGKEMADRIERNEGAFANDRVAQFGITRGQLSGDNLKVGGEGMRAFYDTILPAAVTKWAKRFGGEVGTTKVPSYDLGTGAKHLFDAWELPSLDLTDAMRDAALAGLPLFRRQDPQTQTPAFRHWFGDSKVVDADGSPLVLYHGTDARFTVFELSNDIGFHFGSREAAETHLRQAELDAPALMPVYLRIEHPLRLPDLHTWSPRDVLTALADAGVISEQQADEADVVGLEEVRAWMDAAGYDGIVYRNDTEGGGDSYVVFRPEQIKSADGNHGTFDPTNPDIRFRRVNQSESSPAC